MSERRSKRKRKSGINNKAKQKMNKLSFSVDSPDCIGLIKLTANRYLSTLISYVLYVF